MTKPLLSIITPSYNQARYLEQTLRSVLDQDYPNVEYLVVDGGSSDGSVEIIKRYSKKLSWWVSEPDSGQAEAINKGLRRAKGDFIAWINSDDTYLPGAFQAAVNALLLDPGIGLVYGDVSAVNEDGWQTRLLRYGNWGLEGLMCFQIIGQPAVFMRRTILDQVGYLSPDYHFMLDTHLWLKMGTVAGMLYVPQTWATARFHSESKNVALAEGFAREADLLVDWMQVDPVLAPHFQANSRKIMAAAWRFKGRYLLDGGQYTAARNAYLKSLFLQPHTALQEWNRLLFSLVAPCGAGKIREWFSRQRQYYIKGK